jgi:nitrite reductase/ring-hydroxylating ferredoxin subunit
MERREFSKVCLFGGLGFFAGLVAAALMKGSGAEAGVPVFLGHLSRFPVGGLRSFPERGVALLRTGKGAAVLSTRCTHMGCRLRVAGQQLLCPCHGGTYSREGKVTGGPPPRDLDWFEGGVSREGVIYFYPGRVMAKKMLMKL